MELTKTNVDVCAGGRWNPQHFVLRKDEQLRRFCQIWESERANFIAGLLNRRIRNAYGKFLYGSRRFIKWNNRCSSFDRTRTKLWITGKYPCWSRWFAKTTEESGEEDEGKNHGFKRNHAFNVEFWWWKSPEMTTNPCLKTVNTSEICRI